MPNPRFAVLSDIRLSTGAVEQAGGVVIDAFDDHKLVVSDPPPTPAAVIAAITAPKPRTLSSVLATLGAVAPYTPAHQTRRRDAPDLNLSTEHGVAAALKAEAPPHESHDVLAIQADAMGFEASASHHAQMFKQRAEQRAARKQADRRKARRGWR